MPNGIETNYQYDESNRLKGLEHIKETVNLISFNYSYDRNGNITQIDTGREGFSNLNNSLSYTYDQINQLIGATNPINDSNNEVFEYDDLGNRLTRDGETFQAIYDESNRLIENQSYTYTYDLEGNMTSRTEKASGKITQYGWDEENQLVSIIERDATSLPPTKTILYVYDVLGRRIEKNINGVITRYVYDNEDILFELDGNNQVTKVFTHGAGIDEPYSVHDKITNSTHFYHADHLGSIVGLSDVNGLVQQHYVYDSFGRARVFNNSGVEFDLANAPIQQPFGYTSRELDSESDLYYYRARYYSSDLGRFISEDPAGYQAGDLNLYRYVKNTPLMANDPTGKWLHFVVGGVIGAIAGYQSDGWRGAVIGGISGIISSARIVGVLVSGFIGAASSVINSLLKDGDFDFCDGIDAILAGLSAALGSRLGAFVKSNFFKSQAKQIVNVKFNLFKAVFVREISEGIKQGIGGIAGALLSKLGSDLNECKCRGN